MAERLETKEALLAPLDDAAYERASALSSESIRAALRQAADDLRQAAKQTKRSKVDPKLRFR